MVPGPLEVIHKVSDHITCAHIILRCSTHVEGCLRYAQPSGIAVRIDDIAVVATCKEKKVKRLEDPGDRVSSEVRARR